MLYNLSTPKPGYTTGGSGRSARRSGLARSGKIKYQTKPFAHETKVHRSVQGIDETSLQRLWFVGGLCEGSLRIG